MIDFRKLEVGRRTHEGGLEIYQPTDSFPDRERYGLAAQLRRAAVSTVSNIAEGAGRRTPREFAYFLSIAAGSAREIQAQIEFARDVGIASHERATAALKIYHEVKRMLHSLINRVEESAVVECLPTAICKLQSALGPHPQHVSQLLHGYQHFTGLGPL